MQVVVKVNKPSFAMALQGLKLGPFLKEIRIILCQNSSSSAGIRDFVKTHYVPLKKNNPSFPILIRECSGVEPKIYARYDFGKETSVQLKDFKSDQVVDVLKKLATAQ